ncbi:putative catalase [Burkholderia ambifaria MEX-5]|uniref:Putative catalase n=1 Tax=Burkholderia ambifaria MEX-5 TaxID=396597 RepID=B1T1G7_9BURK|nr:putative catalase [Burkholderia ambifaria MEX-5]
MERPPSSVAPAHNFWRWVLIGGAMAAVAAAFGYAGGWLDPHRITPQSYVTVLQHNGGLYPGYRSNHAKGVCVTGYFEGNGAANSYSTAPVFATGHTHVVG